MTGPGWLTAAVAGLMLLLAACCSVRIGGWRLRRRAADLQADALHVLMGVAMAGMLEPRISPLPGTVWRAVFAIAAVWFGWQAARAHRRRRPANLDCTHPAPHAVESAAMLYMLLPARSAMPGMAEPGVSANPAMTLVVALVVLGYVVWTADQLGALSRARTPAAAGPTGAEHGLASQDGYDAVALAPRFAVCCKIVMGLAMGYMLLAML